MIVTLEFIKQGERGAGGYTHRQLQLLGLNVPAAKGWKRIVLGREITEADAAEYLAIGAQGPKRTTPAGAAERSAVPPSDVNGKDIWLYVLALANGKYYVGISGDLDRRLRQHRDAKASEWSALHPVRELVFSFNTGTQSMCVAEQMEDQATIELMLRHGLENVRGGHFCAVSPQHVELALRSHGRWDAWRLAQLRAAPAQEQHNWDQDVRNFLQLIIQFHDRDDRTAEGEAAVYMAGLKLTRSRYWRDSFAPCLGAHFWGRKGVLPVLLSFALQRPVGCRLVHPYEVLAAALTRGREGDRPHKWLFLAGWETFCPPTTPRQALSVQRWLEADRAEGQRDTQFDDLLTVLLPALRHRLRVG